MWGETVDGSDIMNTIWPRLAPVAEKLWSDESVVDLSDALDRLQNLRGLLLLRGVAVAPIYNKTAREGPSGPGSFNQ